VTEMVTETDELDPELEASIQHDLRVLNARLYTEETRRATESFLLREVADHAWRRKARVGPPTFWWPTERMCVGLAPLGDGDSLVVQIDADAILWANDAEARRALRMLELDERVVAVLREVLAVVGARAQPEPLARAG
jgi:hypothetical protein